MIAHLLTHRIAANGLTLTETTKKPRKPRLPKKKKPAEAEGEGGAEGEGNENNEQEAGKEADSVAEKPVKQRVKKEKAPPQEKEEPPLPDDMDEDLKAAYMVEREERRLKDKYRAEAAQVARVRCVHAFFFRSHERHSPSFAPSTSVFLLGTRVSFLFNFLPPVSFAKLRNTRGYAAWLFHREGFLLVVWQACPIFCRPGVVGGQVGSRGQWLATSFSSDSRYSFLSL